ncbi:hypothetical protein ABID50_000168 [Streptococcus parasuis]|uniref:Uncharacterized protein n=1 Tax=Streptococcus parasuis TaxID=1501662 RepID=A0ABV2EPI4_9STRE
MCRKCLIYKGFWIDIYENYNKKQTGLRKILKIP